MSIDFHQTTDTETRFRPTPAQRRAKSVLHKSLDGEALRNLTPEDSQLPRYIAPTSIVILKKWIKEDKDFWPWLLTPSDCDERKSEAQDLAYDFISQVLKMEHTDECGILKEEIFKAKMKAAEFILVKNAPHTQIIKNTQNNNLGQGTLPPGGVPRGLKGQSPESVAQRVRALESATDRSDHVDVIPEEEIP